MDELRFYEDDFKENPRDSERSDKVVHSWMNRRARYAVEDIADTRCLRIVAERLVVRRIILGLGGLDAAYVDRVASIGVFGPDSPSYADLAKPHVFVAMAFVPLTPAEGEDGNPCLARLYCVGGLCERHELPLAGMDEPALQASSWFLEGLPSGVSAKDVTGRSWLLAAHLLSRVVANRDVRTARNLARHYIVTGDVSLGEILPVETLRKAELERKQFSDFKWIMSKENNMNIPSWKIEKPKTLDEAYRVIECMQNVATQSLFRFLRDGDLEGTKEQHRIGADLFAREEGTNLASLEVVHIERERLLEDECGKAVQDKAARLAKVADWLRAQRVDCAMMFYLLAVNGDEAGIMRNAKELPINAVDDFGRTAVDWALIYDDIAAAKLLHRYGGAPNPRWQANERLKAALERFCGDAWQESPEEAKLIVDAIDCGLSPETHVAVTAYPDTTRSPESEGTLFAVAARFAKKSVIDACLRNGADENAELELTRQIGRDPFSGEDLGEGRVWHGTAADVLGRLGKRERSATGKEA